MTSITESQIALTRRRGNFMATAACAVAARRSAQCNARGTRRRVIYDRPVPPLLSVRGLERSFYGVRALNGVDLTVERATITGLIGPNGAGKTTFFHCVSGVVPPEAGTVVFDGEDITGWRADRISRRGLVRTFQIARGVPRLSVLENLMLYGHAQPGERLIDAVLS